MSAKKVVGKNDAQADFDTESLGQRGIAEDNSKTSFETKSFEVI